MISVPLLAAINHLLAQEPWAKSKLAAHSGKVACLNAGVTAIRLKVTPDGMLQSPADDEAVQMTIHVRLSDLPLIAQHRDRAFSYVRIEGDADFANTISQLSQSLKWDAEYDLSKVIGDMAARRIADTARATFNTAASVHQTLAENIAEYLLEEKPMLMRPHAVAEFASEVAKLRDDVERLSKRIEKLKGSR